MLRTHPDDHPLAQKEDLQIGIYTFKRFSQEDGEEDRASVIND